jgi:3-oxoacyl-[acyl-carrier protein] reductase
MRLAGKVAVVTGAAGGIGRAISLKFAEEGATVVVSDKSLMAAESVSEKIKEMECRTLAFEADVCDAVAVGQLFAETVDAFDTVDIVVSNAGLRRDAPFHNLTAEQWDAVVNVHMKGCFNCAKAAQEHMVEQQAGKFVIVGAPPNSPAFSGPGHANYSAANAGLMGITTSLAVELGPYNVNVNCVAPDFIETQMMRDTIKQQGMYVDDFKRAAPAFIPLKRLGTPEDVANVALFLGSAESDYVTGQTIAVRGGP